MDNLKLHACGLCTLKSLYMSLNSKISGSKQHFKSTNKISNELNNSSVCLSQQEESNFHDLSRDAGLIYAGKRVILGRASSQMIAKSYPRLKSLYFSVSALPNELHACD